MTAVELLLRQISTVGLFEGRLRVKTVGSLRGCKGGAGFVVCRGGGLRRSRHRRHGDIPLFQTHDRFRFAARRLDAGRDGRRCCRLSRGQPAAQFGMTLNRGASLSGSHAREIDRLGAFFRGQILVVASCSGCANGEVSRWLRAVREKE